MALFNDWFTLHFCPAVKAYCEKVKIAHKALLVLNNVLGHPANTDDLSELVRDIFIPPTTTSLLQLMNPKVLATLRAYHLGHTFAHLTGADSESKPTVTTFCMNVTQ